MTDPQPQLSPKVIALLNQGNKIGAIKEIRVEHGLGLKDAKDVAESYIESHPEMAETYRKNAAVAGKGRLLLLLGVVVIILAWKLLQSH